jgi:hypothetical protein
MDWKDYRRTGVQCTRGMGTVSNELQNMLNMAYNFYEYTLGQFSGSFVPAANEF